VTRLGAKLQEQIELLQRVQKMGGTVSLLFSKNGGSRANLPDVYYKVKDIRGKKAEGPVHVIVSPVNDPERSFSMAGETKLTEVRYGSEVIAF